MLSHQTVSDDDNWDGFTTHSLTTPK